MNYSSSILQLAVLAVLALAVTPKSIASSSNIGWDYAVTLKDNIQFMDSQWKYVDSAAHKCGDLSALTFDESEETIYFHGKTGEKGSIFSLRHDATTAASPVSSPIMKQVVQRTGNDSVTALAYDPIEYELYWTDREQSKIFKLNKKNLTLAPQVVLDLSEEGSHPYGIAIDICRRQLYWTNRKNQKGSVERSNLNGSGRLTIADSIFNPSGIVVDQLTDRIFWIDDSEGVSFMIESANLDGSDRQLHARDTHQTPIQLAVTADSIYWTDLDDQAVWKVPKRINSTAINGSSSSKLPGSRVFIWEKEVHGVVARTGFYQQVPKNAQCVGIVKQIQQRMLNNIMFTTTTPNPIMERVEQLERDHCFNGGTYVGRRNWSKDCECLPGFQGARCEINMCHNFCINGICKIEDNLPKCYCEQDLFVGTRCEHNLTVVCARDCELLRDLPNTKVPGHCQDFCYMIMNINATSAPAEYRAPELELPCSKPSVWTGRVIIVLVVGIVLSLTLVAVIVHGLRLIYKPKRPHIKKTFVVRKQLRHNSSSDTPLTNRPLATEQCEITIENCCNMNICETPCFDPKLVEQTFSSRDRKCIKEDKKILINSMEDDLLS